LTCERFARLETDVDDRDEDVLIAITADGARRRVEELSDGTREQLFLALRLAAIERHVVTAQPIPVMFDDVLLESDDDRARRILTALADLAQQTQVIVLTHHQHLVGIAETTVDRSRLDVIDLAALPPRTAPERPTVAVAAPEETPEPDVAETAAVTREAQEGDEAEPDPVAAEGSTDVEAERGAEAEDDAPAPADAARKPEPTPTLAEELEAALAASATVESPYGEQTSLL
jgi:hypothetical protein